MAAPPEPAGPAGPPVPPDAERRARRRRVIARLAWVWLAFWLVMFLLGAQEHFWTGGRRLLPPLIDYGTAALVATLLVAWKIRRADRLDPWLDRPWQWFLRWSAWLPLELPGYIAALHLMRAGLWALVGQPLRHGRWSEVVPYEAGKFLLFYALFGGIHFGLKSYYAWLAERLAHERQARLAREAQLAQLTQQLQPHFLFNALNTISSLIHTDPDGADALLTRLATLLRAATDAGRRPEQPLADELALLRAYADIMIRRFGDRAAVAWDTDPALNACPVPTLGLQPLLENCFVHGVEKRRAPTRIVVRAFRVGPGRFAVEVEDDGNPPALPPVEGVGSTNLRQRLDSLHGSAAILTLAAKADASGFVARVEMPCAC